MKERLDVLLVKKGFFESREKAKRAIMAGMVYIDGQRFAKAGSEVDEETNIVVKGDTCPYVSRGGLKLAKAIEEFQINLEDKTCMDIGASTGGFTDCMLKNGAKKVYSIDVGYGQLDYKLRTDKRVVNMEKCNARYLNTELITDAIDFASIDVSFISLKLIFPVVKRLLSENAKVVCLVKPQFEAGREQVGKNGIVKDPSVHEEVIRNVIVYAKDNELSPCAITFSPIKGAKGNIEYLLLLQNYQDKDRKIEQEDIIELVKESHNLLKIDKKEN